MIPVDGAMQYFSKVHEKFTLCKHLFVSNVSENVVLLATEVLTV